MKKLSATIGKIIFYVFVLAVFGWTASLTLQEMRAVLPNDPITPYFALALFDGGAFAWLTAWLGHARGLYQRSISVIMLVLDIAGIILLASGRLLGGGQSMVDTPTTLEAAVIYGVIIATLANLIAIYAFHTTDPDTMEEIETSILEDTLRDEAMKQANASIEGQARELGAILAARATGQLKYRLRLPMAANETAQMEVIDVESQDVSDTAIQAPPIFQPRPVQAARPAKAKPSPLALWIARAATMARMKFARTPQPDTVYQQTTPAPQEPPANAPQPTPAPQDVPADSPANIPQPADLSFPDAPNP